MYIFTSTFVNKKTKLKVRNKSFMSTNNYLLKKLCKYNLKNFASIVDDETHFNTSRTLYIKCYHNKFVYTFI